MHLCFQLLYQVLNFAMIVSSALMIWKGLMVATEGESPIVVVLRLVIILINIVVCMICITENL